MTSGRAFSDPPAIGTGVQRAGMLDHATVTPPARYGSTFALDSQPSTRRSVPERAPLEPFFRSAFRLLPRGAGRWPSVHFGRGETRQPLPRRHRQSDRRPIEVQGANVQPRQSAPRRLLPTSFGSVRPAILFPTAFTAAASVTSRPNAHQRAQDDKVQALFPQRAGSQQPQIVPGHRPRREQMQCVAARRWTERRVAEQ